AACRLFHLRLSHRIPRHASPGRGGLVRFAGVGGELVAGDHWTFQYLWQSRGRLVREPLPQQVCAFLDVRLTRAIGAAVSCRAQDRMDVLPVRCGAWVYLAGYGAADGWCRRETIRDALSRDAVWTDRPVAPDRRLLWRVARGDCDHTLRQLPVDVVCRRFVGCGGGFLQLTDPGTRRRTLRSAGIGGFVGRAVIAMRIKKSRPLFNL